MGSNGNSQTDASNRGHQPPTSGRGPGPLPPKAPPPRHLLTNGLTKATEKAAILAQISKFGRAHNLQHSTVDALKKLPLEAADKVMGDMPTGLSNADAFVRDRARNAALENNDHALAASLASSMGSHAVNRPPPAGAMAGDAVQVLLGPLSRPVTVPGPPPAGPAALATTKAWDTLRQPFDAADAKLPLETRSKEKAKIAEESRWKCPRCDEINNSSRAECNNCGWKRHEVNEPGLYEMLHDRGVAATEHEKHAFINSLGKGAIVNVVEVKIMPEADCIRGRIQSPYEGWISLRRLSDGYNWAKRSQALSGIEHGDKKLPSEKDGDAKKRTRWSNDGSDASGVPGELKPLMPGEKPPVPPSWAQSGWPVRPPNFLHPQAWAMYAFAHQMKLKKEKRKKKKKKSKGKKRSRTRSGSSSSRSLVHCNSQSRSRSPMPENRGGKARSSKGRPLAEDSPPAVTSKARSSAVYRPADTVDEDLSSRGISDLSPLREVSPLPSRRLVDASIQNSSRDTSTCQIATPVSMSSDATRAPAPDILRTQDESDVGIDDALLRRLDALNEGSESALSKTEGEDGNWPAGSREQKLQEWLEQLDGGRGILLQYFESLRREFSADFSRIREMRLATPRSNGILGTIDAYFWEVCGIRQMGHRLLLAKGINALE